MGDDDWTHEQHTARALLENMTTDQAVAVVRAWIEDNGIDLEDLE